MIDADFLFGSDNDVPEEGKASHTMLAATGRDATISRKDPNRHGSHFVPETFK